MRDLPNLLTVSRIAAIPLMVVLASFRSPGMDFAACVVFSIAGITDYFDGKLARDYGHTSDLGRMLDQLGRRHGAVGAVGVGVEVDAHPRSLGATRAAGCPRR